MSKFGIISTTLQHHSPPGSHGDAIFGHHLNIGSLIGLFCEGLQEQIQSRVYFYKNSRLVSRQFHHNKSFHPVTIVIMAMHVQC